MSSNWNRSILENGPVSPHDTVSMPNLLAAIQLVLKVAIISIATAQGTRGRRYWRNTIITLLGVCWHNRTELLSLILVGAKQTIYIYAATGLAVSFFLGSRLITSKQPIVANSIKNGDDSSAVLRPMVFPAHTTHARMFPTKHSFGYSYLLVGIPIGWNGPSSSLLSAETTSTPSSWFSVHVSDYLARGFHPGGLQAKLREYLISQGVAANRYPFAYLVTAPRILGFSFNPVSFWYLYDEQRHLSAMILEVNNTFDERRMYFMEKKTDENGAPSASNDQFQNDWAKDFHVSPFNDREGSYSLTAKNPATFPGGVKIDNNIVLRSEDGKAKIVARVFSTEPGLNPVQMSEIQVWTFLLKWAWVGFLTNPRILREARVLWVKKLKVFYRPEVFKTSIGRNETPEEIRLELVFRKFLEDLSARSATPISFAYTSRAGSSSGRQVVVGGKKHENTVTIEINVLTPAFYAEAVKCQSVSQAFQKYCFQPGEGEAMVYVSDPELVQSVLSTPSHLPTARGLSKYVTPPHVYLRSGNIGAFILSLSPGSNSTIKASAQSSDIDYFVESSMSADSHLEYSRIVTKLILIDRIAFGFAPLFSVLVMMAWAVNLALLVRMFGSALQDSWSLARYVVTGSLFWTLHGWSALNESPRSLT